MTDRTRKILKWLRIAWTVFFAMVAVLLSVLWVRSYKHNDCLFCIHISTTPTWMGLVQVSEATSVFHSENGVVQLGWERMPDAGDYLEIQSRPIEMTDDFAVVLMGVEDRGDTYYGNTFAIHHRTLFVLITFITVAPWALSAPRRFSLRTLLIATTLVAAVLGLLVWWARR